MEAEHNYQDDARLKLHFINTLVFSIPYCRRQGGNVMTDELHVNVG